MSILQTAGYTSAINGSDPLPESLERHGRHHFVHVRPHSENELEPGGSGVGVTSDERTKRVTRVRPMIFSLTQTVNQNHTSVSRDLQSKYIVIVHDAK